MKQENTMILNGVKYYLFTEEELSDRLREQKLIALMERDTEEIKAGRRKTMTLDEYKKRKEEQYGRKLF